jgi:DNA-binding transcriptional MerR regulator
MVQRNYKLIQEITKGLGLNEGEGFSISYIKAVLSEVNERRNEEVELIASALDEAAVQVQQQLLNNFDSIKKGKAHWVRVLAKRLNEKNEAA